ncbi:MAG TPA: DUF2135 domain-containing protein [Spirochaetota bacterium]|nr:DUF2135 domain-containing protein [Spirochaetota bacterium]
MNTAARILIGIGMLFLSGMTDMLQAAEQALVLESPVGGFTRERLVTIAGRVAGDAKTVRVIHNGTSFVVPVANGRFKQVLLAARGDNLCIVRTLDNKQEQRVSFFAEVPKVDLKVFLYWDVVPSEYIDLWVHEPSGEICKWNNRTTKAGGTLFDLYNGDIGRGPQYYALDVAPPGEYGFSVHYYTKQGKEPRRCHVVFVIHEGTNDERREEFTFVLPRQHSEHVVKRIMIEGRAD